MHRVRRHGFIDSALRRHEALGNNLAAENPTLGQRATASKPKITHLPWRNQIHDFLESLHSYPKYFLVVGEAEVEDIKIV